MPSTQIPDQTKIIKKGTIVVEVKDIASKKIELDKIIKESGAFFESDVFLKNQYNSEYNTTIRVQASKFESLLQNLSKIKGDVVTRDIKSDDITYEYYDVQTRLGTKRRQLQRYYDFISKAKNTKDLLEIEAAIQLLTEEIESMEGRIKVMHNQIAHSTLYFTMRENHEFYASRNDDNFFIKLWNKFKSGGDLMLSFMLAMVSIWPFFLLGFLLYFSYKKNWLRLKKTRF